MDAHVTREPVDRELRRRQLAQRLVVHQARTKTIFLLTGLSRHQLATMRQRWRVTDELRRRGPPPTSFKVFRSTLRLRAEASALAVFWRALGNIAGASDGIQRAATALEFGERLCEVFEAYLACFPKTELEFEHLVLLVRGLEAADDIGMSRCGSCEAVILVDLLEVRRRLCSHCQRSADAVAHARVDAHEVAESSAALPSTGEGVQQELF